MQHEPETIVKRENRSTRAQISRAPARIRLLHLFIFFLIFAAPLFIVHLQIISLPFYWDEQGQFIPTALDLFRHGDWVAHSTVPNVHPPGVEVYLVLWYKMVGYSIAITRMAMLLLGAAGLLFTFLLAIELSQGTNGAPAFWPPLLLLASPLFYTQSFMAQLDMPAMVLTLFSLLLFVKRRYAECGAATVLLVLCKETALVTPFVFFIVLSWRRDWRRASYFIAPAVALGIWLVVLHNATGYWLGNPGFAHYNVAYPLHPVRIVTSFLRRIYYLFFAELRWIGALALILAARKSLPFRSGIWHISIGVFAANVILVSLLGGAELERYLLPVLPLLYIAIAVALSTFQNWIATTASAVLVMGLAANLFWNPPYPFPYENNYASIDFVRLEQEAAAFSEENLKRQTIATAWPYTASLRNPDYGFVKQKLDVIETNDLSLASIEAIGARKFNILIVYNRTWVPKDSILSIPVVRRFLTRYYDWTPEITASECAQLGFTKSVLWSRGGLETAIYMRAGTNLHAAAYLLVRRK